MRKDTTVLGQILHLIPDSLFDNLVTQHQADKGVRFFTARHQLAVLLYAQLAGLATLRSIVQAIGLPRTRQGSHGLVPVGRSTLAETNRRIPWQLYRDLFFALQLLSKPHLGRHTFPLPGKLFSLDSSTVPLCLSRYPWATFRARKGALKLHTLLDHDDMIPDRVIVTNGRVHDLQIGKSLQFQTGETVLMDRGYFDSTFFDRLCRDGVFFVTRMKGKVGFEWSQRRPTKDQPGVLSDWIGTLGGKPGLRCPHTLRLIRYRDPETRKELEFITNLLDPEATVIADLYKQRWQIELFFKWIKQHLKIKTFFGADENAVMTQIWIAMIAYLLIRVLHKQANGAITPYQLLIFITTRTLHSIPINQAWQVVQRSKRRRSNTRKNASRKQI